ncbi:MAG: branched-chain alpha-keto acid dehydrogenase subunit E2, partial [Paracoccaceae bacterium]
MWRSVASNALTILLVLGFVAGGGLMVTRSQYSAAGPLAQAICLKVDRGSNMRRVSQDLENRGAVSSGMLFRVGADYAEKTGALKAGSFLVPAGASMEQILDIVTQGGRSTCGTEVVYRVGITRAAVQVRALDPATGRYRQQLSFDPSADAVPAEYANLRDDTGTRFRIALAEGVTSWQIVEELRQVDVLTGDVADVPPEGS